MIAERRKAEIVRAFQLEFKRGTPSDITQFTLDELKAADAMLHDRNEGYGIAMRHRIAELELREQRKLESRVWAWNVFVGFIVGVVVGVTVAALINL